MTSKHITLNPQLFILFLCTEKCIIMRIREPPQIHGWIVNLWIKWILIYLPIERITLFGMVKLMFVNKRGNFIDSRRRWIMWMDIVVFILEKILLALVCENDFLSVGFLFYLIWYTFPYVGYLIYSGQQCFVINI